MGPRHRRRAGHRDLRSGRTERLWPWCLFSGSSCGNVCRPTTDSSGARGPAGAAGMADTWIASAAYGSPAGHLVWEGPVGLSDWCLRSAKLREELPMAATTLPGGEFTMGGDLTVTRVGYGAMQLAGP